MSVVPLSEEEPPNCPRISYSRDAIWPGGDERGGSDADARHADPAPRRAADIATKTGYLPPIGKKVTVLTAGSVSGTFTAVTGTQLTGEHWVVSYKATGIVLTVVSG
jgi:hypothetical protein